MCHSTRNSPQMSNIGLGHLPPFKHGQDAPSVRASSPKLLLGQVVKPVLRCSCPSVLFLNAFPTSVGQVHRAPWVEEPQREVMKAKGRTLDPSLNVVLLHGPLLTERHLHLDAFNWWTISPPWSREVYSECPEHGQVTVIYSVSRGMPDFQASLQILVFSQWARQSQYKAFNTATDTEPFVPNIISIKWNLVHLSHLVDIESPADSTVQLSSMKVLEKGESFSKLNRTDLLWTANLLLLFMGIYKLNK